MITDDGWLDFAVRVPGPADKVYSQPCTSEVYVPHDAVGYLQGWYGRLFSTERDPTDPTRYSRYAAASVTGIVLDEIDPATGDAKAIQHYPLTASCWASGSRSINTRGNAFETERVRGNFESLETPPHMVRTHVRIIREIIAWKGWTPRRPADAGDMGATLYEHRECVRFGAAPTVCPSGRADPIWAALQEDDMAERVWCAERYQTWIVGKHGAAPVAYPVDDAIWAALYGKHARVMTGAQLDALLPK